MVENPEINKQIVVNVTLRQYHSEDGYGVYVAGFYIGSLKLQPNGTYYSFSIEAFPKKLRDDPNFMGYESIDHFLRELPTIADI